LNKFVINLNFDLNGVRQVNNAIPTALYRSALIHCCPRY
jgi:hypothetical protein